MRLIQMIKLIGVSLYSFRGKRRTKVTRSEVFEPIGSENEKEGKMRRASASP